MPKIPRQTLRRLLDQVLRTDADLEAFFIDYFPEVSRRLSGGMDRISKVNQLLVQTDDDEILAALEQGYPQQVSKHLAKEPGIEGEPSDKTLAKPVLAPPAGVIRVACYYDPADQPAFKQLRTHLSPLIRAGVIALWASDDIGLGLPVEEEQRRAASEAEIVLLLVSSDMLATSLESSWFSVAHERWRHGQTQLIPILVRPALIEDSKLASLQMLPRGGRPISAYRNFDEAWLEVTRELATAVKYRSERV